MLISGHRVNLYNNFSCIVTKKNESKIDAIATLFHKTEVQYNSYKYQSNNFVKMNLPNFFFFHPLVLILYFPSILGTSHVMSFSLGL